MGQAALSELPEILVVVRAATPHPIQPTVRSAPRHEGVSPEEYGCEKNPVCDVRGFNIITLS